MLIKSLDKHIGENQIKNLKINKYKKFYSNLNLDDIFINVVKDKQNFNLQSIDSLLRKNLIYLKENIDKSLISPKNKFEDLNYDTQNYLVNICLQNGDLLIFDSKFQEFNSIFEYESKGFSTGECSKCYNRGYLYFSCSCNKNFYCSKRCNLQNDHRFNCFYFKYDNHGVKKENDSNNGLTGLDNLGNTCYMNSALQCLSNCVELTDYFLNKYYLEHIRVKEKLGSFSLSDSFCELLKHLWWGNKNNFAPHYFKQVIQNVNCMFEGYEQHDCHEFLINILDSLNDELNKVVETSASIINPEEENKLNEIKKSKLFWTNFKKRNQSIISDLFYGQFKSTLKCPNCKNLSTNYDPFLSLTLPIPEEKHTFSLECYFIFFNLKIKSLRFILRINNRIRIFQLRKIISDIVRKNPYSFYIYHICQSGLQKLCSSYDYIDEFNCTKKIFIMEIDPHIFYNGKYKNKTLECLKNEEFSGSFYNLREKIQLYNMNLEPDFEYNCEIKKILSTDYKCTTNGSQGKLNEKYENIVNSKTIVDDYKLNSEDYVNKLENLINNNSIKESEPNENLSLGKTIGFYSEISQKIIDEIFESLMKIIFEDENTEKSLIFQNVFISNILTTINEKSKLDDLFKLFGGKEEINLKNIGVSDKVKNYPCEKIELDIQDCNIRIEFVKENIYSETKNKTDYLNKNLDLDLDLNAKNKVYLLENVDVSNCEVNTLSRLNHNLQNKNISNCEIKESLVKKKIVKEYCENQNGNYNINIYKEFIKNMILKNSINKQNKTFDIGLLKNFILDKEILNIKEKTTLINNFNFVLKNDKNFDNFAYCSDENNFLSSDFIKVPLNLFIHLNRFKNKNVSDIIESSTIINPPLFLTINKNWSLKYIHKYIFEFIKNLINKRLDYIKCAESFNFEEELQKLNNVDLFLSGKIQYLLLIKSNFGIEGKHKTNSYSFNNLGNSISQTPKSKNNNFEKDNNFNDDNYISQSKYGLEKGENESGINIYSNYLIENGNYGKLEPNQVKNSQELENNNKICLFCKKEFCLGCELEYSDDISFGEYLKNYVNNDNNLSVNNDYHYSIDYANQNNNLSNKSKNQDFSFNLYFKDIYKSNIESLKNLNNNIIELILPDQSNKKIPIFKCFDNFQREEKLEKGNQWKCYNCKSYQQASKKIEIFRTPKILIIHFNRFSHFNTSKNSLWIDFPMQLNMEKYVSFNHKNSSITNETMLNHDYELFAVSNHYGSLNSGHYSAYAKNPIDKMWYEFNDSYISRINEEDVGTSSAYLLFYKKKNLKHENFEKIYTKKLKNYSDDLN